MDIASAFDISLSDEQEAKFNALRQLQAKKLKSLMASLENKEKEIAKLKVLGKDNRRTQMIQALRSKIRDQELITDVVKEELARKTEMSTEEVNDYIIRKTLSGPKRFRPLSREELENKVAELDKKLTRASSGGGGALGKDRSISDNKSVMSAGGVSTTSAKQQQQQQQQLESRNNSNINTPNATTSTSLPEDVAKIAQLLDEVNTLRSALTVKDSAYDQLKGEVARLRVRNAELRDTEEGINFQESELVEYKRAFERLSIELDNVTVKLAETMEENTQLRAEKDLGLEQQQLELESLQDQCEKLLQQNATLLQRMAEMEATLERSLLDSSAVGSAAASISAGGQAKEKAIHSLEYKLSKAQDKIKETEAKVSALKEECLQIPQLMDKLRERNLVIKEREAEIKRLSDKINRLESQSEAGSQPGAVVVGGGSDKSDDKRVDKALLAAQAEIKRLEAVISDLKQQNKTTGKSSSNEAGSEDLLAYALGLSDFTGLCLKAIVTPTKYKYQPPTQSFFNILERILKSEHGSSLGNKVESLCQDIEAYEDFLAGSSELTVLKKDGI